MKKILGFVILISIPFLIQADEEPKNEEKGIVGKTIDASKEATKKVIDGVGQLGTAVFDQIIKRGDEDEDEEETQKPLTIMEVNLINFLGSLDKPIVYEPPHIKGSQAEPLERAKLAIDFPILRPIIFRFQDAPKDGPNFVPHLQIGKADIFMRIYARYDEGKAYASIRFYVLKEDAESGKMKKYQTLSPFDLKMHLIEGIPFFLRDIKLTATGLDKDSETIHLVVNCRMYEKYVEGVPVETLSDIGPCNVNAKYNKKTKQWDNLNYELFKDAPEDDDIEAFDEFEEIKGF